ncbi:dual specificity protein phosphatase 19 [Holotrichia oblita]|uniref:Dual specificity protein phosphatase 19 n=1 Tax=Holotrichia oblita TaxID=644536 RepID=A0ACB9T2Q9_HOLOL|nr:dual specificity protein phosphatase 19 [Holotrichia oblita]
MSLLEGLMKKMKSLKDTETTITCADGRRFVENKQGTHAIANTIGFVVDTKPDNTPALIITNLYLGSQDCCEESVLREYNIRNVLSIGVEPLYRYENIQYKVMECLDLPETNIKVLVNNCVPYINNSLSKNENILIHCNAGVSRSSAIVIGYLMLEHKLEYDVAYDMVKQARSCIKPNVGFESQLISLK